MENKIEYYNSQIALNSSSLKKEKRRRNVITTLKLLSFSILIWTIYLIIVSYSIPLLFGILFIIAIFVLLTIVDSKIFEQQRILESLIFQSKQERDYLLGDLSTLDSGEQYIDANHNYTSDLDIFGEESLFQSVNRTVTINGSNLMAEFLSEPCLDRKEIEDRQNSVEEIKNDIEWSRLFRAFGKVYPTMSCDYKCINNWVKEGCFFKKKYAKYLIYLANILNISSWVLAIMGIIPYAIPEIFSFVQLAVTIIFNKRVSKHHSELNSFIKAIGNYFYLIKIVNNQEFKSSKLVRLKYILFGDKSALISFASLNKVLGGLDQRGNILVMILLDSLYMRSLHQIISLDSWKVKYSDSIAKWIKAVSEIDVLISMANYSFNHSDFTFPRISSDNMIYAKEMCHPLLRGDIKVCNDFNIAKLKDLYIVTGANMAGKSTFLRSVGVNLVLASSGNVVCSKEFSFSPMAIFTSMRTTDNLSKGTSYFHAELLRLKKLVDTALVGTPTFIILDEMLKGTNSNDKLNGSIKFLKKLEKMNVCGLVATHDLLLGELSLESPKNFHNVCFEIEHDLDDIVYDYKLKIGISQNMNASILLEQMGLI